MPRNRCIPSRPTLLLAVLMAALIGGAWWWVQPPPEPVYEGQHLTWWLIHGPIEGHWMITRTAEIESLGAPAVKWLAYQVEHGRHDRYESKLPAIQRLREAVFTPEPYDGPDERVLAAETLRDLGPAAEAAIPALARALKTEDLRRVYPCASALNGIGPPSREIVHDLIAHGSVIVRTALIETLLLRLDDRFGASSDDELDWVLATIVQACHDPDHTIRRAGLEMLEQLAVHFLKDRRFRRIESATIRLVGDGDAELDNTAANILRLVRLDNETPIPVLIRFLDNQLPANRIAAAEALATIDRKEKQSADALLKMTHDPDPKCRAAATRALRALGVAAPE